MRRYARIRWRLSHLGPKGGPPCVRQGRLPAYPRAAAGVLFRAKFLQKKEKAIIFVAFHKNEYSTAGLQEAPFSFQLEKGRCFAQSEGFRGKTVEKIYISPGRNIQGKPQDIVVEENKNNKIYLGSALTTILRFGTISEVE